MELIRLATASLLFSLLLASVSPRAQNTATTRGAGTQSVSVQDSTGDIYAIIVGISNYPGIAPLRFADKDAILFRDFLKTPSGGNTRPDNILSLINDSAKAADFNVGAYRWLQKKSPKKGDRLYIYFSGHGDAMSEDLYFLLPFDCAPDKDDHNYLGTGNINMQIVKELFIKPQVLKGVNVYLIVDACRSNQLPGGADGQQNFIHNLVTDQKTGEIMLLSTGAGQVSIESPTIGNGHGLFTYYLVDGLAGAADKDSAIGGDNDGKVSLGEISTYVKTEVKRRAKSDFNTTQIPDYCCSEKDQTMVATVDAPTYTAWENSKKLQQLSADQNLFAVNNTRGGQRGVSREPKDTAQIHTYNLLLQALNRDKLLGDSSADSYYQLLSQKWPGSEITEDARYAVATRYINFCQQKINLFLSGKGLVHIIYLEKAMSQDKKSTGNTATTGAELSESGDEVRKLKTLVTTGFDVAEIMMEKAIALLQDQSELIQPVRPKLDFLKAMRAYGDKNGKLLDAALACRQAITSDPLSAGGYLLMGWIYQDMQNDSCEFYFRKAASIAPKWAYPMNGLGNFYVTKNNKRDAMDYFEKAVALDSLFANAYRNLGTTCYNLKRYDSAKMFLLQALKIDPCDPFANEGMGSANAAYISPQYRSMYTDTIFFPIARRFFLKAISCDSGFASGYERLSELYSAAKKEDSAFAILQRCIAINPANADGYRYIGNYYLRKRNDTAQAEIDYKKAIQLDPSAEDNYYSLASLYRKLNDKTSAITIL
ncbi:MAG TPA: caspase family protein, partial [Puia sp.]|nr:caspase family protein [Puia sp.]